MGFGLGLGWCGGLGAPCACVWIKPPVPRRFDKSSLSISSLFHHAAYYEGKGSGGGFGGKGKDKESDKMKGSAGGVGDFSVTAGNGKGGGGYWGKGKDKENDKVKCCAGGVGDVGVTAGYGKGGGGYGGKGKDKENDNMKCCAGGVGEVSELQDKLEKFVGGDAAPLADGDSCGGDAAQDSTVKKPVGSDAAQAPMGCEAAHVLEIIEGEDALGSNAAPLLEDAMGGDAAPGPMGGEAALDFASIESDDALGSNAAPLLEDAMGGEAAHAVMVEEAKGSDAALPGSSDFYYSEDDGAGAEEDDDDLEASLEAIGHRAVSAELARDFGGKSHVQLGLCHGNHTHG